MDPNSLIQKIQEALGEYKANDPLDLPWIISRLVEDKNRLEDAVDENARLVEKLDRLEDRLWEARDWD